FWSPLPGPVPSGAPVEARHGFGWSAWRQASSGLAQEVEVFVPWDEPVKIVRVRLANAGETARRLSVFFYARLVLGPPEGTVRAIVSEIDTATGALLARNPEAGDFADGVAFAAAVAPTDAVVSRTADRATFLGPRGTPAAPAAVVAATALDGRVGADLD